MSVKREDGILVTSKEEVRGLWKSHFELINEGEGRVLSMGLEAGRKQVFVWKGIDREEVEREQ